MTFYNVCPAEIESGGPELAHQMCHRLNDAGLEAYMYYIKSNDINPQDVNASDKYIKYNTFHAKQLSEIEQDTSVVVFNEGATGLIPLIKHCHKVLWWMSVDNYLINTDGRDIDVIRKEVVLHLVQSKYAYEYVRDVVGADEKNIMYVSDYIGDIYMTEVSEILRQNIVLYNPKKGLDRYKFENETDYEGIENCMHYICDNFYEARKDFEYYIDQIKQEKSKFNDDVVKFSNFFMNRG